MKIVWYSVGNSNTRYSVQILDTVDIFRPIEQKTIVEMCAEDYYWKHDPSVSDNWFEKLFIIYETKDSLPLNSFYVELLTTPVFHVYQKD